MDFKKTNIINDMKIIVSNLEVTWVGFEPTKSF